MLSDYRTRLWLMMCVVAAMLPIQRLQAEPAALQLARDGQALQQVIVSAQASPRTREAAEDLAAYLGRITGASFQVLQGTGEQGLVVGTAEDFPALAKLGQFELDQPFRRDDYLLRTHERGAYVIGASETAVHLAVWDLLHRAGYRLFFPTDTWEVVPQVPNLQLAVDAMERPDYVTRQAPRGAPWSNRELWSRWRLRNRVAGSFSLSTGHAYDTILRRNRAEFEAHPEYYALNNGERRTTGGNIKFCISNPGLRKLVVDHAVRTIQANPDMDSVSMDPSDGSNWCECSECEAMGSVSDLAIMLANEVAEAINALGYGPKYVGIYAYNQHSPPPSIEVHPHVVVSAATSFIRGGFTINEMVEGWRAKGAVLGIREYHDVFTWSHDQPRRARGGNIAYLTRTIAYFHEQGARFMNSENADSWGANGLGYWLSPRLLWDVDNVNRVDELVEDFLDSAFGQAKEPMRDFYHLLNFDHASARSNEDVVARMYRLLQQAKGLSSDPQVQNRLDDLILYTRYLELYYHYRSSSGNARQKGYEQVWRHVYRMQDRMMVSTVSICHRGRYRDRSVSIPEGVDWTTPEPEHPWKSSQPFEQAEIQQILAAGIEANQPTELDFQPVNFSEDLVPATPLNLPVVAPGQLGDRFRGRQTFYTWLPEGRSTLDLQVTGGLIAHYRDRGNVKIALYAEQEATLEAVAEDETVVPDGQPRDITLATPYSGLHTLEWTDGGDMTRVVWPDDLPMTLRSTLEDRMRPTGRWSLYFYVPRGTSVVGGFATTNVGTIRDGDGNQVFNFADLEEAGYFSVEVPQGQDGKLWQFRSNSGARMLMTVPPYMATSGDKLLLPREVVKADAGR